MFRLPQKAREIVGVIFSHTTDAQQWVEQLTIFMGHFARFEGLSQLGDALVRHLPEVAKSALNHAAWDAWADAWETARGTLAVGEQEHLEIPLRLLRTGIAYLKTNDEGRLLALPREERRILREALGLPQEKGN